MSRRKQKQPQQLLNLTSGTSRILENGTPLAVKSHSSFFIPDSLASSSTQQLSQLSLVSNFFHKRHRQSAEKLTPVISPEIVKDSISPVSSASFLGEVFFNSHMASPKLGLSATTTSSSSSPCASLCPPLHPGSPSRVPEGPPSPVTPAPSPGATSTATAPPRMQLSIALILEELRVLQQRQIHQMQITEEICRQVLRLGGASYNIDTPSQNPLSTLPQLCLEEEKRAASPAIPTSGSQPPTSVAPLLACFSSLLPSQAANKPPKPSSSLSQILQPQKPSVEGCSGSIGAHSFTKGASQSSAQSTSLASSTYPLALSLALPSRYLHEKSSNTTPLSGHSGLTLQNSLPVSLSNVQHSQQSVSEADTSSTSTSSSVRHQHVCRFCSKSFSSDSALQIHLRSHTGERPFQCPVCFSRFTTRGNLKVHFLRHREQNPELSLSLLPPSLFGMALGSSGGSDIGQTLSSGHNQKTRISRFDEVPDVSGTNTTFSGGPTEKSTPSSLPLPPTVDLALLSQSLLQLNRAAAAVASITASSSGASSTSTSSPHFSNPPLLSPSALTGVFKSSKQQHFDENTPPHVPILSPGPYSQLVQHSKLLFPSVSSSSAGSIFSHPALGFLRTPLPSNSTLHQLTSSHPMAFTSSSSDRPACPSTIAQCSLSSSVPTSTPTSETSKLQRLVEKLEKVSSQTSSLWGSCSSTVTSSGLPSCCFSNASTSTTYVMASPTSSALVNSSVSNLAHDVVAALGLSANVSSNLAGQLSAYNAIGLSSNLTANQCGVCLRVMSCPRALRLHQATHLGERPFPCKLCGRSFSTKGSLRSHLATHHARPANARVQNSCPLCQRKFTNALVLQHHIRMHLGGQLPPGISDDPAARNSEQNKAPVVETDVPKGPALPSQIQTSAPTDDAKSKDECKSDSASPGHTTQPNCDPLSSHNTQTTLPGSVDQTCGTVLSEHQQTDQSTGVSDCIQVLTDAEFQVSVSTSSSEPISKSTMSSKAETNETLMDLEAEASTSSEVFPCSESSTEKICDPLGCLTPESTQIKETSLATLQILSEPNSPELAKVDTEDFCKPLTPKHEHVNVPDKDPKTPSALETVDVTGEDSSAQTPTFVKETQKHFHFGSYEREDKVELTEAVDTSVPISLTPTLPSPLSRPEKKTYCCAECGKEYASRSGLKGHMKHHGVYSKTRLPVRSCRSSSDQINTPVSSLNVPATRSSANFWNQYKNLLNTTADAHETPSGSQGESEPARAVRSSARSRMESKAAVEAHKGDET